MEIVDVGHGFYMVKFDELGDREKVIGGCPWIIFDHYLAVRPWKPDFIASEIKIDSTMAWIRFPSLGMEYYDKNVLMALASAVGKPIRVDIRTIEASRGKFARVCVELDLNRPVVGKVWFRNHWFNVEYEGLHLLCNKCGSYGHIAPNCQAPEQSHAACSNNESQEKGIHGSDHVGEGTKGETAQPCNPSKDGKNGNQVINDAIMENYYDANLVVTKVRKNRKEKIPPKKDNNGWSKGVSEKNSKNK